MCWKCGAPLVAGRQTTAAAPGGAASSGGWTSTTASPVSIGASAAVDPRKANRAAFWLGILFPYVGLPVALAFMMCDDPRRQEVGRICLLWSLISGVVHVLLLGSTLLGAREIITGALSTMKAAGSRGMGGGLEGP